MLRRYLTCLFAVLALSGCVQMQSGAFVSEDAVDLGGSLYAEKMDDSATLLLLDGPITPRTSYVFQSLVEAGQVNGLIVTQSQGGDLLAAHQIGRSVRSNQIHTMVLGSCVSACVDIFIAGRTRAMAETALLGLHAADDVERGYALDKAYWDELWLGRVNDAAYTVPNRDIWIIDAAEARRLGLATEVLP